jgi:hypothetical protein
VIFKAIFEEDVMSGMQRTKILLPTKVPDAGQACMDFSKCGIVAYSGEVGASFAKWAYAPGSVKQTVTPAPGYGGAFMAGTPPQA